MAFALNQGVASASPFATPTAPVLLARLVFNEEMLSHRLA